MPCKCNKLIIGLAAGLVLPVAASYAIYLTKYEGQYGYWEFIKGLLQLRTLGKMISISVLANLIMFIIAITYEKYILSKGLVIATFVWVLIVLAVKFLL